MKRMCCFLVSYTQGRDYRYLTTTIVDPYILECDQVRAPSVTTHTPGYVRPCALTVSSVTTGLPKRKRMGWMEHDPNAGIAMCVYVCVYVCMHMCMRRHDTSGLVMYICTPVYMACLHPTHIHTYASAFSACM